MSRQNVELTNQALDVPNRRDQEEFLTYMYNAGPDTPVGQHVWLVTDWRGGKVARWRSCASRGEALQAVGLLE